MGLAGLVLALRRHLKDPEDGSVCLMTDADGILSDVREFIPSGLTCIDQILGGGWAVGRASEVAGAEGAGKSALTHLALRACQRNGGDALYLDFENALDRPKMLALGIDPDHLLYARPSHIEKAWDLVWETLAYWKNNPPRAPCLIVWDSIAASLPKAELDEASSGDSHVGLVARSMSKGCRRMFLEIARTRAHMMWVNQEREQIGGFSRFGPATTTTGGRAVRYAASQRVRCTVRGQLKASGKTGSAIGMVISAMTRKNRLAPPYQKAEWVIDFRRGPSEEATILRAFLQAKRIHPAGKEGLRVSYLGAWSTVKFTQASWFDCMEDAGFRAGALEAYTKLLGVSLVE